MYDATVPVVIVENIIIDQQVLLSHEVALEMVRAKHAIINFVIVFAFLITLTAQSSAFLPQGWTEHSSNGKIYYYNHKSGTSQWEKPVLTQNVNQQGSSQTYRNQGTPSSSIDQRNEAVYQQSTTGNAQYAAADSHQRYPAYTNQQHYSGAAKFPGNSAPNMQLPQASQGHGTVTPQNHPATATKDSVSSMEGDSTQFASNAPSSTLFKTENATISVGQIDTKLPSHDDGHKILQECSVQNSSASLQPATDIIAVHPDTLQVESELKEAERKIENLKIMIDELEFEKSELMEKVKIGEQALTNLTSEINTEANLTEEKNVQFQQELNSQIVTVQTELDSKNAELEALNIEKNALDLNLVEIKIDAKSAQLILSGLKSNSTIMGEDLRFSRIRIAEQEKELADAYKEIRQLIEDMKNVAEPSLRRLRQPSFFSRLLQSAFPVWSGKVSPKVKKGKSKTAVTSVVSDTLTVMNRTAIALKENITAISAALEGKEEIIEELSVQLAERADEAEKR